ncbi:Putative transposase of IS4/5 family [Collimonas sp. OK307]|uniref:transposase n=1 Tax=Collimonas sp. OK307 TaxID=1801620 RepID=UPI0008E84E40|nr:transposase [Collimonas sp. OK307]SFI02805.1 Putative transposase of IS4/5 family [Collimonas sp. OK307]
MTRYTPYYLGVFMRWVEEIARENTKFVAIEIDKDGTRQSHPLTEIGSFLKDNASRHKRKFDTNFQDWQLASVAEYLHGFGISDSVKEHHRVFKIQHEQMTYLIPAGVLFKAIFRPLNLMAVHIFRPQSLEQVCVPTLKGAGVHFVMSGLSGRNQSCLSLQQPLSWMWCFPSAKRMWNSAYDYACRGQFACDLPLGKARVVVKGRKKKQKFFVTEMTLLQITAEEEPFEFALGHPTTIVFHEGASFRTKQPFDFVARPDEALSPTDSRWEITDQEWRSIYPIFSEQETRGRSKRKHDLRTLIDGIIAKLGTEIPWRKFVFKTGTWSNASKLYGECKKDSRWEKIQIILAQSRAT